jgi:hypothetical protein
MLCHGYIIWDFSSMESLDELNVHQKWMEGKGNFPQVDLPDELQEELIKDGRGTSVKWSH